jgi:hypothetical protein
MRTQGNVAERKITTENNETNYLQPFSYFKEATEFTSGRKLPFD